MGWGLDGDVSGDGMRWDGWADGWTQTDTQTERQTMRKTICVTQMGGGHNFTCQMTLVTLL